MTLHINSQFNSGNIEVINAQSNPIELAMITNPPFINGFTLVWLGPSTNRI